MRRFKSNSIRNSQAPQSPPVSYTPPLTNGNAATGGGNVSGGSMRSANDSRPVSASTNQSFDFANRPVSQSIPQSGTASLSRTDLIVLQHFWDAKFQENAARDLHFLKFPRFPNSPEHKDLLPYVEIYHLIKTQAGAKIMSLGTGSTDGVYIGFELFEGSQLHIDMDDEWHGITHYRVGFKPFEKMISEPNSEGMMKGWQKPITIEFLEDMWVQKWSGDLMSIAWEPKEIRELGGTGTSGQV